MPYLDGEQALCNELCLAVFKARVLALQELQHLQLAGVVAPLGQAAVELSKARRGMKVGVRLLLHSRDARLGGGIPGRRWSGPARMV